MERPLGGLERMYWLLAQGTSVNNIAVNRIRGPLEEAPLRQALDAAQRRHPMLRAWVAERPGGPVFVIEAPERAATIPLRVVERRGPDHWQPETAREARDALGLHSAPLARATLLEGAEDEHDLLLTFSHVIGDGKAGFTLVRELLEDLARLGEGRTLDTRPYPLPPPLKDLLPAPAAASPTPSAAAGGAPPAAPAPSVLPREVDAPLRDRRSGFVHGHLSTEATSALAARARKEGSTVQGALSAAMLRAVAAELDPASEHQLLSAQPFDLRPHLARDPGPGFAYFSYGPPTSHRVGPRTSFWATARDVRGQIDALLQGPGLFDSLRALEQRMPGDAAAAAAFLERVDQSPIALGSSNLGRAEPVRAGALAWEGFHYVATNTATGTFVAALVTTLEGRLTYNLTYPDPLVREARARRIAGRFEQALAPAERT